MYKNIFIVALIVIFLSSCSQWISVNPLSSLAEPDKKIEGLWKLESKENDIVYLHIGQKTENTMVALSVEHKDDGSLDIVEVPFFITRTEMNNYINVRYEDIEKSAAENEKGYIFLKYSFSDDNTVSFFQFDHETIKSAVQSGKLKGEVYYRETTQNTASESGGQEKIIDSVKITDTSENIIKFINTEGAKFLPETLKFIRMK